jgi:hypothetical protein
VLALAGCGLKVALQDDFALTQTGPGGTLTMVVNDSGTITCNGGKPRPISGAMLIQARDLVTNLDADAKKQLRIAPAPGSITQYTMKLQDGAIAFPDTAAATHRELAPAVRFALAAVEGPCAGR